MNKHTNLTKVSVGDYPRVNLDEPAIGSPTIPLVEHLAIVNNRLESVESSLESVRNWVMGPYPTCQDDGYVGDPNIESQVFRADQIASRLEDLVSVIRNRLS